MQLHRTALRPNRGKDCRREHSAEVLRKVIGQSGGHYIRHRDCVAQQEQNQTSIHGTRLILIAIFAFADKTWRASRPTCLIII